MPSLALTTPASALVHDSIPCPCPSPVHGWGYKDILIASDTLQILLIIMLSLLCRRADSLGTTPPWGIYSQQYEAPPVPQIYNQAAQVWGRVPMEGKRD